MIKIGQKIPDFTLEVYHQEKIKKIKLSGYKDQRV